MELQYSIFQNFYLQIVFLDGLFILVSFFAIAICFPQVLRGSMDDMEGGHRYVALWLSGLKKSPHRYPCLSWCYWKHFNWIVNLLKIFWETCLECSWQNSFKKLSHSYFCAFYFSTSASCLIVHNIRIL